jgi:XTP/dITP diphosphohydrolase
VTGRLVLVTCSPRVPPGLLSWPAWEALRSGTVETADQDDPQLPHLRQAGVDVRVVPVAEPQALLRRAAEGETVVRFRAEEALVRDLAGAEDPAVEVVPASYDLPGARLLDVVAVMDRLRSPGGCPWDAQQTHASLRSYLIEEAYEAYEAMEDGDAVGLREELGDVLLQVVFHARIAQEAAQPWSIDEVAGDLVDKLVRRHPHVFAGASADDLEGSWESLKAAEKGRTSVTEGVPLSQPALSLAAKLQRRASRIGAPVPAVAGPGGELWEAVRRCREAQVDPEEALRETARAYRDRLAAVEAGLAEQSLDPRALTPDEWSERWG